MEPNETIGAALETIAENMKNNRGNFATTLNSVLLSLTLAMVLGIGTYMTSQVSELAGHNRELAKFTATVQVMAVENRTRIQSVERTVYGDVSDLDEEEGLALEAGFPWSNVGGPSVPWATDSEGG